MKNRANIPQDGKRIAINGDWELYYRYKTENGWVSLKLLHKNSKSKGNYWFGFNGNRLSRTKDRYLLVTKYPEIEMWVVKKLLESNLTL